MQVSQIAELDTHAIIGGGQARAFGMSDSAEFFTILSDTLYRDKVRAVAREVICNAWDAHIITGQTDKPIQIKLSDTELTIKDFGPGISDERIVPIYCVFGNSTKAKDETQTGGFGLGSKAPFAYSDHFSVTSCHEGQKIVYAISRGGIETDGKPDIRAMVKVPTKESGITVTVPIRTVDDRRAFMAAVKAVVFEGGILATLNDDPGPMDRIDYTGAHKLGFTVVPGGNLTESLVYALYGTVLYPVSSSDSDIQRAVNQLHGLADRHSRRLIVMCPPNSIGVTPSRESISYTERTKAAIIERLQHVHKVLSRAVEPAARELVRQRAAKTPRSGIDLSHLVTERSDEPIKNYGDLNEIARVVAAARLHTYASRFDWQKVALRQFQRSFRDERRFFRRALATKPKRREFSTQLDLHTERQAMLPILRMASRLGHLDKLFLYNSSSTTDPLRPLGKVPAYSHYRANAYRLIIAPNQREGAAAAKAVSENGYHWRSGKRTIVLVLGRKNREQISAIETECAKRKIETTTLEFGSPPKKVVKREFAYYSLKQVDGCFLKGEPTINAAPIYVETSGGANALELAFNRTYLRDVLAIYPNVALCRTKIQKVKLETAGAVNIFEKMIADITAAKTRDDFLFEWRLHYGADQFVYPIAKGDMAVKALKLARKSHLVADYLLQPRIKRAADLPNLLKLWQILQYSASYPFKGAVVRLEEELNAASRVRFANLVISRTDAIERFAHLRFIDEAAELADDAAALDLIRVLRFLARPAAEPAATRGRTKSMPAPAAANVAPQSLKEAA